MNDDLVSVILAEDNPDHALLMRVVELLILGNPRVAWAGAPSRKTGALHG
jgi:hypothetical protein